MSIKETTPIRLTEALWRDILTPLSPSQQKLVLTSRDAVIKKQQPRTERLLLRQTINRILGTLVSDNTPDETKTALRNLISHLEEHFEKEHGYCITYHWKRADD